MDIDLLFTFIKSYERKRLQVGFVKIPLEGDVMR